VDLARSLPQTVFMMAEDEAGGEAGGEAVAPPSTEGKPITAVLWRPLTGVQAIVGTTTGLISVGGFLFSMMGVGVPSPTHGDLLAVIHDARSQKPVLDAKIDVTTLENALVTTLTSRDAGRAQLPLREGQYRVRVRHPKFNPEVLLMQMTAGQTSELHLALVPRSVPPKLVAAKKPGVLTRIFRSLGFGAARRPGPSSRAVQARRGEEAGRAEVAGP
jgi:hypothetical protein